MNISVKAHLSHISDDHYKHATHGSFWLTGEENSKFRRVLRHIMFTQSMLNTVYKVDLKNEIVWKLYVVS